jgi:hypothetical protein
MDEKAKLKNFENDSQYQDKNIDIPIEPYNTVCEYCCKNITTYAKTEYNLLLFLYIVVIFYFYGLFYGFFIIFITFNLFKNVIHSCPNCLSQISYRYFYPISTKGVYISFKFGKCVIVLKKIYVYIILFIFICFGIYINVKYYNSLSIQNLQNNEKKLHSQQFLENLGKNTGSELTWENLIDDCGANVMVENSVRAIEIFNRKYFKKEVIWKGYFLNAFIQRLPFGFVDAEHLVNLNIRMIPSETIKNQDLVLSLNYQKYNEYLKTLQLLYTGTPIQFKAIFESVGDEWKPHHLHLLDINITDDFIGNKEKVTLFKGINFNVEGHLNIQKEIKENIGNGTIINQTNNNNTEDINFKLDEENENNKNDNNQQQINNNDNNNNTQTNNNTIDNKN